MVMEVKSPVSQGPAIQPGYPNEIEAPPDKKSGEQEGSTTAGNAQTTTDTKQAMKQVGTEAKGSMKTSGDLRQQSLNNQLERKNEQSPSGSPVMYSNGAQTNAAVTKSTVDPTAAARKEAQILMEHGNKMLKEHRYNEAIESYEQGFRTYPSNAFILNKASALLDSGRYAEAVLSYENYLTDPDAPRADEARAAMERAKTAMGGREATITGVVESRNQYEKGAEAFKAGHYQEALDAFDKAYELNPLAEFRYNQAAALEKLGRPYAAADRFQSYLAEKPDAKDKTAVNDRMNKLRTEADKAPITASGLAGGQEWMSRGNRLLFQHKYNEAVRAYEEGFRTYPDSKFLLNKASALLDGGRYSEAYRTYENYLSDPNASRADEARAAMARAKKGMDVEESRNEYDKGALAFKAGKYQEALDAFDKAYELNPLPDFRYNQGAALEKLGRPYAAASRFKSYLEEKPDAKDKAAVTDRMNKLNEAADKAPITQSGHAGGQEWMFRGNRLLNQHKYKEAIAAYDEGFLTYPDSKFIMNKGSALLDSGRYAEAVMTYERYLSDPNAPRADEVREAMEKAKKAMGGREATITGVEESRNQFEKGATAYQAGKYHEALAAFDKAYELNPLADFRYNQAAALDKMGKRELAAQRYESYLAENPKASDAAQVKAHITKLRADAMKSAQSAFDRGQTAFNSGRYNEAAGAFAEAYEQKPFPQFLYNIAASYDKGGDPKAAVRNYQLYLSMYPEANDADKVRRRIDMLQKASGDELMKP